jgi:hypothetical protein
MINLELQRSVERSILLHMVKPFPAFMDFAASSELSQTLIAEPYRKPVQSNP